LDGEGRWKPLQASDIYECRAYLTELYRNALAPEVRGSGYETENRVMQKAKMPASRFGTYRTPCWQNTASAAANVMCHRGIYDQERPPSYR